MEDNMWWYSMAVFTAVIAVPLFLCIIEAVREVHDKREKLLEEQLKQNMNALRKGTEIMAKEITDAITEKKKPVSISSYTLPKPDYSASITSANFDELHSILEAVRAAPQRIVHRTNCPNCGAPLNDQGKCEYCTTITDRKPVVEEKKPDTLICEHGSNGFDELKLYADDKVVARTVIDRLNGIGWS